MKGRQSSPGSLELRSEIIKLLLEVCIFMSLTGLDQAKYKDWNDLKWTQSLKLKYNQRQTIMASNSDL